MPKIILRSNFMKDAPAEHLSNYVKYIGTREGVEKIDESKALLPATAKQLVRQIVKDISGTKNMLEYADYLANPTRENASEFIATALEYKMPFLPLEQNLDLIGKRQNYVDYIARRPRVERIGEHGLFTDVGTPVVLAQVQDEASHHKGAVWTHVVSLRREDAARLGYDSGKQWQDLIRSKKAMLCKNMKIPRENLRWYCAFHNESHHPHVHLMVYSSKDNEGFLTEKGIEAMRSELAHDIFRQDFANIYTEQNQSKASLKQNAESAMQDLLLQMRSRICVNVAIEKDILLLSERLQNTAGKKQYGYLKADVKIIIDRIVDELAKTDTVAEAYAAWQEIQNSLLNTYQDKLPKPLPLSSANQKLAAQKDFKSIKNMVIKEALNIGNGTITFEPVGGGDETSDFNSDEQPFIDDTDHTPLESNEDGHVYVDWSEQYKQARLYLFGDDDTTPDFEKAYDLFLLEAESGNALAMHDLGRDVQSQLRLACDGLGRDADADTAYQLYEKALAAFHIVEEENPKLSGCEATNAPVERSRTRAVALAMEANADKHYTEYRIGKMYNAGLGTEQNYKMAARWFAPAADGGNNDTQANKFALYSLGGLYYKGNGVVLNYETALMLYAKSDMQNFPADPWIGWSAYELAKMHRDGVGTTKNIVKADEHFKKSFVGFVTLVAQSHDDKLQYRIGQMLLTGTGTEKDIAKATEYFEKSARLGNSLCCESADSPYQLAKIYLADETSDLAQIRTAIAWLTKSAEGENHVCKPICGLALYSLAKLYRDGTHVERDEQKAVELFTLSALQENGFDGRVAIDAPVEHQSQRVFLRSKTQTNVSELAAYALGKLHLKSETLPKDAEQAVKWFSKSADLGNQFAQYALGKLCLLGEDIPKDIAKAITLLTKSAEQQNQFAQYQLGKIYLSGEDTSKNIETALWWLSLSAEQGNQYAQYTLGKLYLMGKDVEQDRAKSLEYFTLSAAHGNIYAQFFSSNLLLETTMNDFRETSVMLCTTRLLHHLSNVFQDKALPPVALHGMQIDRKQRRKTKEKKVAQGHAQDDYAHEQTMG